MTEAQGTDAQGKTFTCTLEVRWADSDRLGHVNNTKFVEYMQEARVKFLQSEAFARSAAVVRKMDVEFLHPVKDDSGPITVAVSVLHVGNTSYTLRHVLSDNRGRTCGFGDAVLVGFDPRSDTARPLTPEERAVLEEYLAAPVG